MPSDLILPGSIPPPLQVAIADLEELVTSQLAHALEAVKTTVQPINDRLQELDERLRFLEAGGKV